FLQLSEDMSNEDALDLYADICTDNGPSYEDLRARCHTLEQETKQLVETISTLASENKALLADKASLNQLLAQQRDHYERKLKFLNDRYQRLAAAGSSAKEAATSGVQQPGGLAAPPASATPRKRRRSSDSRDRTVSKPRCRRQTESPERRDRQRGRHFGGRRNGSRSPQRPAPAAGALADGFDCRPFNGPKTPPVRPRAEGGASASVLRRSPSPSAKRLSSSVERRERRRGRGAQGGGAGKRAPPKERQSATSWRRQRYQEIQVKQQQRRQGLADRERKDRPGGRGEGDRRPRSPPAPSSARAIAKRNIQKNNNVQSREAGSSQQPKVQLTSPHQPSAQLTSPHQPSAQLTSPHQPSAQLTSPHQPSAQLTSPHQPSAQLTSRISRQLSSSPHQLSSDKSASAVSSADKSASAVSSADNPGDSSCGKKAAPPSQRKIIFSLPDAYRTQLPPVEVGSDEDAAVNVEPVGAAAVAEAHHPDVAAEVRATDACTLMRMHRSWAAREAVRQQHLRENEAAEVDSGVGSSHPDQAHTPDEPSVSEEPAGEAQPPPPPATPTPAGAVPAEPIEVITDCAPVQRCGPRTPPSPPPPTPPPVELELNCSNEFDEEAAAEPPASSATLAADSVQRDRRSKSRESRRCKDFSERREASSQPRSSKTSSSQRHRREISRSPLRCGESGRSGRRRSRQETLRRPQQAAVGRARGPPSRGIIGRRRRQDWRSVWPRSRLPLDHDVDAKAEVAEEGEIVSDEEGILRAGTCDEAAKDRAAVDRAKSTQRQQRAPEPVRSAVFAKAGAVLSRRASPKLQRRRRSSGDHRSEDGAYSQHRQRQRGGSRHRRSRSKSPLNRRSRPAPPMSALAGSGAHSNTSLEK
uniref:CASP8 associated protein 2 n=2 Tax=Macrostomum lignano TaxID=282301 RepID=A0A1I8FRE5_9PLAT